MTLFTGIKELWSLSGAAAKGGRSPVMGDLGLIEDASMLVSGKEIKWVGKSKDLLAAKKKINGVIKKRVNLKGAVIMPAFIDPHTHMVFAGHRKDEFEMRNRGFSYQEIADKGGGIMSTVRATRKASEKALLAMAKVREAEFIRQGVATVEIKSGYGLSLKDELKILKVIRQLKGVRTVSTYLGAHAIPPEYKSAGDYLQDVIAWLPKIKNLADRVDIFIEKSYFSKENALALFAEARKYDLQIVAHADQLNASGGATFAAAQGAVSVDHCLRLTDAEILKMGQVDTTCVLLPGSDFYLHLPYPPARRLIDAGARVALGTDFNPGSCPTQNLSLIGVLARLEMKMTLAEVIVGFTLNAAHALGLAHQLGALEIGKQADFVILDESIESLFYEVGHHPIRALYRGGRCISA